MEIDQSLDLKTDSLFDRAVLYTATSLFAFTIILVSIQVLIRWLNLPTFGFLHWTQPAAQYILIIGTYLGAAVALRNNEHISIRFLLERIENWSAKVGRVFRIFSNLIVIGFLGIALRATAITAVDGWSTSIGGIGFVTSGYVYLGISIGIALTMLYAITNIVNTIKQINTSTDSDKNETEVRTGE